MSEPIPSPIPWTMFEKKENGRLCIGIEDAEKTVLAWICGNKLETRRCNARLMAKAPDMLMMLQRMLGYSENGAIVGFYPYDGVIDDVQEIIKYVRGEK